MVWMEWMDAASSSGDGSKQDTGSQDEGTGYAEVHHERTVLYSLLSFQLVLAVYAFLALLMHVKDSCRNRHASQCINIASALLCASVYLDTVTLS